MSGLLKKLKTLLQKTFGGGKFLCDTCKYDYGSACQRPERPNATTCEDYKKKK